MRIDTQRLLTRLHADPEFALTARQWDCRLRFRLGADSFILVVRAGEGADVEEPAGLFDEWQIAISADDEVWRNILSVIPPPF